MLWWTKWHVFLRLLRLSSVTIILLVPPFSYSSYNTVLITRTSRLILGTLKKQQCYFAYWRILDRNVLSQNFWWISLFKTGLTSMIPPMLHTHLYLRISFSWKGKAGGACNLQQRSFLSDTEQHWAEEKATITFWFFEWSHPVVYWFYIFTLLIYISFKTTM